MPLPKYNLERFYQTDSVDGTVQLDLLSFQWLRFRDFLKSQQVQVYQIKEADEGRLDLLASRFYNDVNLWWVIAVTNQIRNPMQEVTTGKEISIPSLSQIETFYQTILKQQRLSQRANISRKPI